MLGPKDPDAFDDDDDFLDNDLDNDDFDFDDWEDWDNAQIVDDEDDPGPEAA